ncbi:MAG TPA: YciI family protein [Candidatus Angelobacter sp.]|nr:YciI family protein [Candidatus Angelobacter sp.]
MQYLLLIHHDEDQWEKLTESEKQKLYGGYRELRLDLEKKDKFVGGSQLQPTSTATTVRIRDGKRAITDGPFAETKEQLAGYILVEADDQDDALAIAARIPSAETGAIVVRPVVPKTA